MEAGKTLTSGSNREQQLIGGLGSRRNRGDDVVKAKERKVQGNNVTSKLN